MLAYFVFKNHGPFLKENVFDMRAVESYKEHLYNLATVNGQKILKVCEVHGANASGKSQFVGAYQNFSRMVARSFQDASSRRRWTENCFTPFMFCESDSCGETEYEAEFACEEGRYRYGFSFNSRAITSEWLYFTNASTSRKSTILERDEGKIAFGASVRKECQKFEADIRDDVLALSFMSNISLKNAIFNRVSRCVSDVLPITSKMCNADVEWMLREYFMYDFNETEKMRLLSFLSAIDIAIKDITVERTEKDVRVYTHHIGLNGDDYKAPLEIESDGTRKVIALYSFFRSAVDKGRGLIIDELDSQLHPSLMRSLVNMFYSPSTFGQLIYTCHTTDFFSSRYGRRDQFWLVDKDDQGRSVIYSIADFSPRNDSSLSTAYLSGRYGAVPSIDDRALQEIRHGNR